MIRGTVSHWGSRTPPSFACRHPANVLPHPLKSTPLMALRLAALALLLATIAPWTVLAQRLEYGRPNGTADRSPRTAIRWQPKELDLGTPFDRVPRGTIAAGEAAMSLAELEQIALANHPAIRRTAAQLSAARGRWLQVGLPPNPTLGYLGSEIGNEGRAGQQGAFVSQRFITGGKLRLNRAVVSREIQRFEQQLAAIEQRVLTDIRSAFYDVLAAQASLDLAHELMRIGSEGADTVKQLLAALDVSRVDLFQAEIESASAAILLTQAENRHQAAWRALAALAARPDMPPARLEGSLDGDLPQFDWHSSRERLLTESPELAAAWFDVERARFALQRARVEPMPDISVQGSVQFDDATHDTVASVQIGLPLPLLNRNEGAIREARCELIAAQQEVQRLELSLQQRLAATFERYQNARRQVELYRDAILPRAAKSLELIRLGYTEGEFGYVRVLTTQRTYFETNLQYISSLVELRRSATVIDGLLLEGSLAETR